MAVIKGIELKEGMFISLIGMEVKGENDIYIVERDYADGSGRWTCTGNDVLLTKVKLNGEMSETKYRYVSLGERELKRNPSAKFEIITDLKSGKKAVREYLKARENGETVVEFEETNNKLEKGCLIKFVKGFRCGTFGNIYIGTRSVWEVKDCNNRLQIRELGKKGQYISTGREYGLNIDCLNQILNDGYIVILDKKETLKGELNNNEVVETVVEEVAEVQEESNGLLTIDELKDGECVAVLQNKNTGAIKEVEGSYSEKFSCVYLIYQDPWDVIGYKQEQKETAIAQEVKEVETIEPTTEAAEQTNNTLEVNYIVEESTHTKTGATIYLVKLDRKVSKEEFKNINDHIKSLGGYWSRYTKSFIFSDKEKAYSLITPAVEEVKEIAQPETVENNTIVEPAKAPVMETMEIDNIEQYTVSEELSKRENDCHWVFRSKERNHTAEIQNYLNRCKNELLNALSNTQDQFLINSSIRFFNSYMKKYHALQLRLISNSASMPSVAVAGAGNYNFRKRDKLNDRYGKLLNEYGELTDHFNSKIAGIKRTIKKDKERQTLNKIHEGIKTAPAVKTIKTTIKYNPSAVYNIFTGATSETTAYKYNNYSIIKNWASWRIYDNTGNIVKIEGVEMITGTLKDAKLFLNYLVSLDNKKAA